MILSSTMLFLTPQDGRHRASLYSPKAFLLIVLFLFRMFNHIHLHNDSQHICASFLRTILSLPPQSQLHQRSGSIMVALMAPILLTTIQATPVSLLETPSPAIEEGYKVTSPSVSPTSTKKITKTAPTISPSPFPDGTQPIQPDKASSVTTASVMFPTPTDNSVHDNPSISDIASLGQARTGTTPTDGLDSSAYLSESIANSNYGAIGSLPTMGLPNSSLTPPSTQTKHSTSPTTMVMVSLGSVAAVIIVVVGALTIRRRLKNRRDLQDEDDFDGIGAYASGKKSRYVGLTSFGSTTSSGSGPEIKKPPPLAQHEQFWNP